MGVLAKSQMEKPILGIVRGRFINNQKKILKELANANRLEMKIITFNKQSTDMLIYYVIDSHCKSVYFLTTDNISKNFLFSLRFIYEVQLAGIAIYIVNDWVQPAYFYKLDKEQYRQLWKKYLEDWKKLYETGASWWKPYYRLDNNRNQGGGR